MPEVTFQSGNFPIEQHESVLDCLLRNNQHIPYACKAGMCQACLIKAVEGTPPESARKWIKKTLQEQGYCLACQWVPEGNVKVALPSIEEFSVEVRIMGMTRLNARVMRVRLTPIAAGTMFAYSPGQYLSLINPAGIARSYSIANNFEQDGFVELHIGLTRFGVFTQWLFTEASEGDVLHIRGPAGDCFYTTGEQDELFPIVLAGTGTGLAPLFGILQEALRQEHKGGIALYHGAHEPESLYYVKELRELAEQHANFIYIPVCLNIPDNALQGYLQGNMEQLVPERLNAADIGKTRVYLCGTPALVHSLRKRIFLKGARSGNIFCDPFIERAVATEKTA